ncbi:putative ammonium transporter 1 [Corticium candelabrum]|uniref:putative ammonium transporter 1 n=1 Tax=Corticium candelabrum TaxID=121492 RepID=UPI002E259848|nr:putative ammonium transporter 1 [Corticium candelabrum]XP_062517514.1 putative ammonium transporter 1 [Corticium candelabrum]
MAIEIAQDANFTTLAIIVFLMQAGFAFLEAGSVRSKNTTNILFKNFMSSICGCVAYWACGHAFAFGGGNAFIGNKHFFLVGVGRHSEELVDWFIYYVYTITAATIVSGAMAERTQMRGYFIFTLFCTGWVQPVVTHWAWAEGGWLQSGHYNEHHNVTIRYEDFAGSSVVHVVGGASALIGAALVGPRKGRFDERGMSIKIASSATAMSTLGGFIIVFGFFAFNLLSHGSLSETNDGSVLGLIAVNCILASSGGSLTALIYNRYSDKHTHKWSLLSAINGSLVGMVSISAGASTVYPYGAFLVGLVAGVVYSLAAKLVERNRVDDPLDAIAVHLGGGTWGIVSVPFLDSDYGLFYKGNILSMWLIGWNLCGLLVIIIWTLMWAALIFGIMSALNFLRVTSAVEKQGLDVVQHGEKAYPYEMTRRSRSASRATVDDNCGQTEVQRLTAGSNDTAYATVQEEDDTSLKESVSMSQISEADPVSAV